MTATTIIMVGSVIFVYQLPVNIEKCCSKCTRLR